MITPARHDGHDHDLSPRPSWKEALARGPFGEADVVWQARHQLGDAHYTIGGHYTAQMLRTAAGWRIARYTLTVTFSEGERRLVGIAYRKAMARS